MIKKTKSFTYIRDKHPRNCIIWQFLNRKKKETILSLKHDPHDKLTAYSILKVIHMSGIQFNWNCSIKSYKNGQYVRAINTLSLFAYPLHHETSSLVRFQTSSLWTASLRPPSSSGRGNPRYLEVSTREINVT